ncbi:collagen, type I, alpha 1a-like [Phocoena phocoena]|uniref:collagen, type I, alpha 1a-like n=1 Tax=Phocoena phocoena TaxID=9742 RepID=UPI0033071F8F
MGRRRHGGRAIGPRLSRVTKAAGARPPAGAGGRLTGGEGAGRRRTPGPDRQPAPPAARTADRLRSGPRGVAARRRDVAAWRDEGGGEGGAGGPAAGALPAPPPPNPTTKAARPAASAARERGRGHRQVAPEAGRRVPAHPRSLARTDGGRRGPGPRPSHPHLPARPTGAGRCGHGGRSATAGRGPDDPALGRARRAGAGRGAAGGRTAVPPTSPSTQRRRRTGGGGGGGGPRSGAAAGPGSETHRDAARGSADGDGRGGWTDGVEGRRGAAGSAAVAETRRRPHGRRGGRGADARRREAGGPGAILRARTRVGRQGTTRGLTARGLQRRGGPAAPGTPTGLLGPPTRVPPLTGLATTTAKHPRAAASPATTTLSRAHTGRPTCPTHASAAAPDCPASGTVSTPPGDAAGRGGRGGRHPHVGEAGSIPDGEGGAEGWGPGRAGGDGEGAARTHAHTAAKAAGQGRRGARPGTGRAEARPGHQGNKRGVPPPHTRGRSHDAWDAGRPQPPWGLPTPRPRRRGPWIHSRARRPAPCPTHRPRPRLAARAGATGSSRLRDWASRDVRASPTPTSGSPPRVTARAAPHRTPAWRDPPPTQRGEARAAVGKERRSAPTAGPAQALPRGRGPLLPTCSGSGHRGHCTLGRGSGWGVRYPKAPSRIAREGFSHRGCVIPHPSSLPFGPTEALHKPPSPRPAVGGAGGVCGMGAPERTKQVTLTRRQRARGAAAGRPPTDAGGTAREAHAKEAKRERLLRPRTTAPPTPRGEEAGDRRSGPETTTPASHTPVGRPAGRDKRGEGPADRTRRAAPFAKNATVADDPARRTPDTWHGACGVGSSQPPPGARSGEGESRGVEDPRATSPRRPRVSQRPEAAPRVGVSRAHTREPARRPKRAAQVARAGSGA